MCIYNLEPRNAKVRIESFYRTLPPMRLISIKVIAELYGRLRNTVGVARYIKQTVR